MSDPRLTDKEVWMAGGLSAPEDGEKPPPVWRRIADEAASKARLAVHEWLLSQRTTAVDARVFVNEHVEFLARAWDAANAEAKEEVK